jgi:hypothetical protein
MLFLAVFCGFLAENQREHYIEHKRANTLAASLIKDMRKDTTQLSWLLQFNRDKASRVDSFYNLLCEPFDKINSKTYYRLAKAIQVTFSFAPSNGTINQLKNAGYLRYFSNDSLPGLLSEYDFFYKDIEGMDQIITDLVYNKYYDLMIRASDSWLLHIEMTNKEVPDSIGILPIEAADLKALKGIVIMIRRSYTAYDGTYNDIRKKAVQIIEYLNRSLDLN